MPGGFSLDLGNLLVHLKLDSNQYNRALKKSTASMQQAAETFSKIGMRMSLAVTAPIVGIGYAAVRTFRQMEDAFVGVEKTVDATEDQLKQLRGEFEQLSTEIPVTVTELYNIGEAAGQLGIATENIVDFSNTMAQLGIATNMTATDAATNLAQLANITGMAQTEFDRLGATIVELGNNTATTESKIVDMAMRLAGAGTQAGMAETDIIALAASLASVGIRAEAGGTAFSRIINEMSASVAKGGRRLTAFANVANMSVRDFKSLFETDAAGAISAFITGLNEAVTEGENVTVIMERLGFEGVRVSDVMGRTALSAEAMARNLAMAGNAWENNSALIEEAEKRYRTLTSQIQITKNLLALVFKDIGGRLVPAVLKINEVIQDGTEYWNRLNDETKDFIIRAAGIAAAIGPAALAASLLLKTFRGIVLLYIPLKKMFMGLAAMATGVAGPMLILVGIAYAFRAAWKQGVFGIRKLVQQLINGIIQDWEWFLGTPLGEIMLAIVDAFRRIIVRIKNDWREFIGDIGGMAAGIGAFVSNLGKGPKAAAEAWAQAYVDSYEKTTASMKDFEKAAIETAKNVTTLTAATGQAFWEQLKDTGAAVKIQFKEDIMSLADSLSETAPAISDMLKNLIPPEIIEETDLPGEVIVEDIQNANKQMEMEKATLKDHFKDIKKYFEDWASEYVETAWEAKEQIDAAMTSLVDGMAKAFTDMVMEGEDFGKAMKQLMRDIAAEMFQQAMRMIIIKTMMSIGSSFGMSFAPTASSKGNVFSGGNLQRFDSGGVLDREGSFLMADGNVGTYAENNRKEAIMPLERDREGKLGVRAAGDQQTNVNLKNVTVLDPKTVVDAGDTEYGTTVLLNRIRLNQGAFKLALGL